MKRDPTCGHDPPCRSATEHAMRLLPNLPPDEARHDYLMRSVADSYARFFPENHGRRQQDDMDELDAQTLDQTRQRAAQAAADVREIMAAQTRLRASLLDAQGRAQAAMAALTTLEASMARKYGRAV